MIKKANNKSHPTHPKESESPTVNEPVYQNKFTTFYRVMLILSTIGTGFAVLGIFSIPDSIKLFATDPAQAILNFATIAITLVAIIALVLLWRKDINGFYLKIGTYVASVLVSIMMFFTMNGILSEAINKAISENKSSNMPLNDDVIETIMTVTIKASVAMVIVGSVTFALLWWFAWKNQAKVDAEA